MMNVLLGAASVVIIIAGLKVSSGVLGPLFFAFTLTFLFAPLLQKLRKLGIPSWISIIVMSLVVLLFFGGMALLIYTSTQELINKLPTYQHNMERQVAPIQKSSFELANQWNIPTKTTIPKEWENGFIKTIFSFLGSIIASGTNVGLFLFTLFLMLISSESVIKKFRKRYKQNDHFATQLAAWAENIQRQYLIQTITNLLIAVIVTVTFLLLQIDFAILWGVLTFILAYIPNFGIILASIPPVLIAFIQHGPQTALFTAGAIIVLNIIMDNVVTPRFMGKGLEVPAIVVFLSFIFWTYVFGILGAFLALPITLAIRSVFQESKKTKFLADILSS